MDGPALVARLGVVAGMQPLSGVSTLMNDVPVWGGVGLLEADEDEIHVAPVDAEEAGVTVAIVEAEEAEAVDDADSRLLRELPIDKAA